MIGNDVVDFKQANIEGRYDRPRFLDKVFSLKERKQIFSNKDSHRLACIYWCAKEAAYKAYVRETRDGFLNPKKIHLEPGHDANLIHTFLVSINSMNYIVKIEVDTNKVVAVATRVNEKPQELFRQTIKLSSSQYAIQNVGIREAVLAFLSKHLNKPKHCFSIAKDEMGIPFVSICGSRNAYKISLTHHGVYAAFVIAN